MSFSPQTTNKNPNDVNGSTTDLPLTHSDESQIFYEKAPVKSFWGRNWWKFIIVLVIGLAGGASAFYLLFKKPISKSSSRSNADNSLANANNNNNGQTPTLEPNDIDKSNSTKNIFDDSKAPNSYTPALNQTFAYGKQPIRGVNLGGWLVLEPFITPSYFAGDIVDEWSLCSSLGPEKAKETLEKHYANFIQEADFDEMAQYGLNHVRIPLGFWAVEVVAEEPYVPGLSWTYLLKGISWARKYGLRVLVELHAAPGSQNGWNHSGKQGTINWIQGSNGRANADRTLRIIAALITFFNKPEYQHVTPMFGVLNEPRINFQGLKKEDAQKFYLDAYKLIRNITGDGKDFTPWLVYHDGFIGLGSWQGFMKGNERVALDTHSYIVFDPNLLRLSQTSFLLFPCAVWGNALSQSRNDFGLTVTGEWTVSTDDCAKYLNGVGGSPRYEGICDNCTCTGAADYKNYDPTKKAFMLQFAQAQIDAFESNSGGWFYWTWKTENHVNPTWDYQIGVKEGWIPKDLQNRPSTCKLLQQQYPVEYSKFNKK